MRIKPISHCPTVFFVLSVFVSSFGYADAKTSAAGNSKADAIKSYCIDFNWDIGRRAGFAPPGKWAEADPKTHVQWYKDIGANVIQTFAVSCNGYAWYKSDLIPEQPGLKHHFLTEMVKLGHAEGMKVMGYFCIAANTRWGKENPELSYGTPSGYHIPYTDEYLAYLDKAITDAIKTTGIDGFMIDWVWMPSRKANNNQWLDAEKKLYTQLMGETFPGEDKLTKEQELAYGRKAIDRCWKTIHKAAKTVDPDCIIWLTTNSVNSPLVKDSTMYKEVDWLMGETGKLHEVFSLRTIVGKDTHLITCMSDFGGNDASKDVPEALDAGVGVYGYAKPSNPGGTIDLENIFPKQLSELSGNAKRIAVMARAYRGLSIDAVWQDGTFVEPENPPPFRINIRSRGGFPDKGRLISEGDTATLEIETPYYSGRALLTRIGDNWPSTIVVHFKRHHPDRPPTNDFRVANGQIGVRISQKDGVKVVAGELTWKLDLHKSWKDEDLQNRGKPEKPVKVGPVHASTTDEVIEFGIPSIITGSNPALIWFEWSVDGQVK